MGLRVRPSWDARSQATALPLRTPPCLLRLPPRRLAAPPRLRGNLGLSQRSSPSAGTRGGAESRGSRRGAGKELGLRVRPSWPLDPKGRHRRTDGHPAFLSSSATAPRPSASAAIWAFPSDRRRQPEWRGGAEGAEPSRSRQGIEASGQAFVAARSQATASPRGRPPCIPAFLCEDSADSAALRLSEFLPNSPPKLPPKLQPLRDLTPYGGGRSAGRTARAGPRCRSP